MKEQPDLIRVWENSYTVYNRESMYCFVQGKAQQESISLAESFAMGARYLFCPAPVQDTEIFADNASAYLKRWNRKALFFWVENPQDMYIFWRVHKLEDMRSGQFLALGRCHLYIGQWDSLSIQDDSFIFDYKKEGGYGLGSGNILFSGESGQLCLRTTQGICGTFEGEIFIPAGNDGNKFMEALDAGLCYSRMMEESEENAVEHGFVSHAVNRLFVQVEDITAGLKFTPQVPIDPARTRLELSGNRFASYMCTAAGRPVFLTGEENAALVFQEKPVLAYKGQDGEIRTKKRLYLSPSGDFKIENSKNQDMVLLCGLTGTETIQPDPDAVVTFHPSMPAVYPYRDGEKMLGTTSWISFTEGAYYCQPEGAGLYTPRSGQELRFLEIPMVAYAGDFPPVPLLPFRGLQTELPRDVLTFHSGIYQKRRELLLENCENLHPNRLSMPGAGPLSEPASFSMSGSDPFSPLEPVSASESVRAVTVQGMTVEVTPKGQYQWIGFANTSAVSEVPQMRFDKVSHLLQKKFQEKELLYVVKSPDQFAETGPSEGFSFSIEGIRFSLLPDDWRTQADGPTMVIFQYSAAQAMEDALSGSNVLRAVIEDAYTKEGEVKKGCEELLAAVKNAGFCGMLALNVPVLIEKLPDEVGFLLNSVEPERFYASYLIVKAGQVIHDPQKGIVLGLSAIHGLVDYETGTKLSYTSAPPDYDYLTREIRIQVRDSRLVSFTSSSELLLNRLFEASTSSPDNPDGSCLVLNGSLSEKDGEKVYQYCLKQCVGYILKGSGIDRVWIREADLTALGPDEGMFLMSGVLSCRKEEGADLLGYGGCEEEGADLPGNGSGKPEGLPFDRLVLRMKRKEQGNIFCYSMEYGLLNYDRAAAVYRKGSFPDAFAVSFDSLLIEKFGETPQQKGYLPISAPIAQGVPEEQYQGILWNMQVGSLGELSGSGGLSMQFLCAFWMDEEGTVQYYTGLKLPPALSGEGIRLQGIFRLGFGSISLEIQDGKYFIKLHNFYMEILGASFPKGNSDIFLFSDGEHIGWYAVYLEGADV